MTLSDYLWKRGLFNHNLLKFDTPHHGRGQNRGILTVDQRVWYGERVVGHYDRTTGRFKTDGK